MVQSIATQRLISGQQPQKASFEEKVLPLVFFPELLMATFAAGNFAKSLTQYCRGMPYQDSLNDAILTTGLTVAVAGLGYAVINSSKIKNFVNSIFCSNEIHVKNDGEENKGLLTKCQRGIAVLAPTLAAVLPLPNLIMDFATRTILNQCLKNVEGAVPQNLYTIGSDDLLNAAVITGILATTAFAAVSLFYSTEIKNKIAKWTAQKIR